MSSASRVRLTRGHTLRQQLLKYASRSLSGQDWKMAISVYSLFAEPWSDIWLRSVSLYLWMQVLLARWSRNASPGWQLQNQELLMDVSITWSRKTLATFSWPVSDHGECITVFPGPERIAVDPLHMCWIRSLTFRLQLLRYANWPLLQKDSEIGISDCCLCAETGGIAS